MIFYRTPSSKISTYATPALLYAALPAQCLLFTPPNDLASGISDDYTNNVVRKLPSAPFGRKILQYDEGVAGWNITVEGNYVKGDANDGKLHSFEILPQSDDYHTSGIFGIVYPNGPNWLQSIDPSNTKGLMITNRRGRHVGITKELVDFSITFSYGGDVV